MSLAIKSTDPNKPPLFFGTFTEDIEPLFADHPRGTAIGNFPVDKIADLGTDILPIYNSINDRWVYPSPDGTAPYLYMVAPQPNNSVNIGWSLPGLTIYDLLMGDKYLEACYLMLSTPSLTEQSRVYLIMKKVTVDGVVKWDVVRKNPDQMTSDGKTYWYLALNGYSTYTPYTPPEEGGGLGLGDTTSDSVDFPGLPLVSALGTGVVNMYQATQTSLRQFSQYLWTGDFIDNVKKLFQDPMEAVVSVQIVPYTPTHSETPTNVFLSWIDTGVPMYPITNQYVRIDCGTLEVSEFWASFLDYPPHTDVSIFLPYIGVKQLSVQDVMSRKLHLIYNIDSLTGSCVAMLKCSGGGLDSVLYSWNGSCNMQIPIGARDFSSIYSSVLSLAASAGLALATKGVSKALTAGAAAGAAASAINSLDLDTHTRQAGSTGSVPGYMGNQIPYLIITRPKDSTPSNFNELNGRPSNLGGKIGDYSGFLSLSACHIDGIIATEKEKAMIESELKAGILI